MKNRNEAKLIPGAYRLCPSPCGMVRKRAKRAKGDAPLVSTRIGSGHKDVILPGGMIKSRAHRPSFVRKGARGIFGDSVQIHRVMRQQSPFFRKDSLCVERRYSLAATVGNPFGDRRLRQQWGNDSGEAIQLGEEFGIAVWVRSTKRSKGAQTSAPEGSPSSRWIDNCGLDYAGLRFALSWRLIRRKVRNPS